MNIGDNMPPKKEKLRIHNHTEQTVLKLPDEMVEAQKVITATLALVEAITPVIRAALEIMRNHPLREETTTTDTISEANWILEKLHHKRETNAD